MHLVIPGLITPAHAAQLHTALATAPFVDGSASAGPTARDRKRNLELATDALPDPLVRGLAQAVRTNALLARWALPRRSAPLLFNRYDQGMTYGDHVDNALGFIDGRFMRTDLAITVFLTPPEAYEGGDLVIETDLHPLRFKLPAGHAIVYRAGTLHRVEPVLAGSRICAVSWIESLVRLEQRRQILFELSSVIDALGDQHPEERMRIEKSRTNLLRLWADPT